MFNFFIPLIIVAVVCICLVTLYNNIVTRSNRVNNAFSQIDVQLKRRFDLVPNLVETVKGYAKHEKETFEKISSARSMYNAATTDDQKIKANGEMSMAMGRLLAISESYPELQANTNFISLQHQLVEIEEKIGFSRQFYNDTVLMYNNSLTTFPSNIIASTFNFKDKPYFKADEAEKETPKVSFS